MDFSGLRAWPDFGPQKVLQVFYRSMWKLFEWSEFWNSWLQAL